MLHRITVSYRMPANVKRLPATKWKVKCFLQVGYVLQILKQLLLPRLRYLLDYSQLILPGQSENLTKVFLVDTVFLLDRLKNLTDCDQSALMVGVVFGDDDVFERIRVNFLHFQILFILALQLVILVIDKAFY